MRRIGLSLSFAALTAVPLSAYGYPVSDSAIREAYFLGARNNVHTQKFLAAYTHVLPMPKSGPHVATITLATPYAQIVDYSSKALNFSAVDAVDRFLNSPAQIRVEVEIDLTATYTPIVSSDAAGVHLRTEDFWRDFTIKLLEGKTEIEAQHIAGRAIYLGGDVVSQTLSGAIVTLDYSAQKVSSDSVTVQVLTPDRQDVQSVFDLSQLR